ncbi:MAG: pyridoxal phosphate-dependent aminotransferase [Candidatus Neomarinimicrobiota bacterium]|nr:pyridoxal phosphate-dependent aminotransferase [Candidatus Neomarinimicrobiota bacterium]
METIQQHLNEISKSPTLNINEISADLEAKGKTIYKFGFGQSPFPVPDNVVDALKKYANEKSYLPVEGLYRLRETVANYYINEENISIAPDNVLIGPGSKELMFILQMVLDCTTIIPSPSWVSYEPQSIILKKQYSYINTSFENNWKIFPDLLVEKCEQIKGKKLLILNYPGNPTGVSYSSSELEIIANICRENNTIILSDEIYGRLHHTNNHQSIAKYFPEGTIITSGLSKWCGAGGWRLGTMVIPKKLQLIQDSIAVVSSETFSCVSSPVQYAAITAFNNDKTIDNYLFHSRRILSAIGNYCSKILSDARIKVHPPDGGFYLFADFSNYKGFLNSKNIKTSNQFCSQLLKDTGVALLPGSVFGRPKEEFTARLAYVNFDGAEALRTSETLVDNNELTIEDLIHIIKSLKSGISLIVDWLETN